MNLDFEFETTMGGEGEAAPAAEPAAEPAAPAEPAAEPEAEAAAPVEPTEPEPTYEDLVYEVAATLREQGWMPPGQPQGVALPPAGPQFGQPPADGLPPLPEVDPYDPESVIAYLQAKDARDEKRFEQMLDSRISPIAQEFQSAREAQEQERGNQVAEDMLADNIARHGDFATVTKDDGTTYQPGRELARNLAEQFYPAAEAKYGFHPRAAEAAIEAAAKVVRDIEATARQDERTKLQNHNATLAGAQGEPIPSGVQTATIGQPVGIPDPAAIARKHAVA